MAEPTVSELQTMIESLKAEHEVAMSHMWLILCGALVMFMHAGFAMLESGCCRSGFVQSVLEKNLLNCCVSTIGWWAFGWAFAYGDVPENGFIGSAEFFSVGKQGAPVEGVDDTLYFLDFSGDAISAGDNNLNWFFQWAFCMTSATIVSGAVAERLQLGGYCIFCFVMTSFVYPVVVAWTWSCRGWLNYVGAGYMDFAGSGIVHLCGGMGALVGAKIVGPRDGRFVEGVDQEKFEAHNVSFIVLGTFILWFGWYGFNCGSTLGMSESAGRLAAQVAMNTTLSPAISGLIVTFTMRFRTGRWSAISMCGGILGGLVSITAPCGSVTPGSALIIGAIGGLVYMLASDLLPKLGIDDPVEAFAVHGACGIWGTLAAALFDWGVPQQKWHGWGGFSPTDGATLGSGLLANFVGIIAIMAWSGTLLGLVFLALKATGFLRISKQAEAEGLDLHEFSPKPSPKMVKPQPVIEEVNC
jgi:Amt family ammonium transporter